MKHFLTVDPKLMSGKDNCKSIPYMHKAHTTEKKTIMQIRAGMTISLLIKETHNKPTEMPSISQQSKTNLAKEIKWGWSKK